MSIIRNLVFAGMFAAASFAVAPAYALTAKECSVKYQAAKEAGTLGGLKWNDFRKAECASDAAPATETKKSASKTKSDTTTTPAAAGGTDGRWFDDEGMQCQISGCQECRDIGWTEVE